jgi:raffinose/stachyose/melibiose transport system substrate-binding protein
MRKSRAPGSARRVLAALTALTALAILAAWASTSGAANGASAPSGTLNMIVSSAPGSDAGFAAINQAFSKAYPKVKIKFQTIPNQNYAAAEGARLTAHSVDLLVAAPVQVPSYAKGAESSDSLFADGGGFLDLSNQPFMQRFTPTLLAAIKYKGKSLMVPTGLSYVTGVYYNKSIFQKYALSVPTTWAKFVKLANTLKTNGVTPLGIGGKDSWPAGLTMIAAVQGQYPTSAAMTALAKGLWQRQVKLTDPKPQAILDVVQQIYGFAEPNFAGIAYNDIPAGFASGQYAMTPDGTWNNTTIAAAVGSNFKFGYFPLPTSNIKKNNAYLAGKNELTLAVPSAAKNKTAALAWLDFFSQPKHYKLFLDHAGFAPSEPNIPASPFMKSIAQYTKVYLPVWPLFWHPNPKAGTAAIWPFNYTDISPLGTLSPQQAAAAAEKAWEAGF